jgi:hypothetical protein
MARGVLPVRGFQVHVTHYDPVWYARKARERPFDLRVAGEIVDAMADSGLNLLVVDVADGVVYRSHPELKRRYSVPIAQLRQLAEHARQRGIEVVPKLNFAQSGRHHHNEWFRPHRRLFDSKEYWRLAFELVDELIGVCRPERFFHVGMDEDHDRSHRQFAEAICTLAEGMKERDLRAVMWKDSPVTGGAWECHGEKSRAAEKTTPRDVVQVPWGYRDVRADVVRSLKRKGFEVWGATGGNPDLVREWRDALLRQGGSGILLTAWRPCRPGNCKAMLDQIRTCGPLCAGG